MRSHLHWMISLYAAAAVGCRAFLGIGDTSFVTVIANPAEAANWAAQLKQLSQSVQTAQSTLQDITLLKAYAGDPKLALADIGNLQAISYQLNALAADGQTLPGLGQSWTDLTAQGKDQAALALLARGGAQPQMLVFGQLANRTLPSYASLAADASIVLGVRNEISQEQSARSQIVSELSKAWASFQIAESESAKQALLTKITQLNAQSQALESRRRSVVDDMAVADRQRALANAAAAKASDEQLLAESKALSAAAGERLSASEAQRLTTLQKPAPTPAKPDYSGLKLWTPADAGSN